MHHVLELWHQRDIVDDVEVDLVFRGDLDTNVSTNEEKSAALIVKRVVLVPFGWLVFIVVGQLFLLEEDHGVGGAGYECFIVDKHHLPEICRSDHVRLYRRIWLSRLLHCVTLSIKRVHLIQLRAVKRLERKVKLSRAGQVNRLHFLQHLLGLVRVQDHVVSTLEPVEGLQEEIIVLDEAGG